MPRHLETAGQVPSVRDPTVSNTFKTTVHQFNDARECRVAEHDYQNFAVFMQDMNQLHDVAAAMKANQHDGRAGKDPEVTKARGAAYAGGPHRSGQKQSEASLSNKEVLQLQTRALSRLPGYTVDNILSMQQSINDEIEAVLQKESQKPLDASSINPRELQNFNHIYQKHRQARQAAKGA